MPARLGRVGSFGNQKQPSGAGSLDHLASRDDSVGAELVTPPRAGRQSLPDADRTTRRGVDIRDRWMTQRAA